MEISSESVILNAKQYKIEELNTLAASTFFIEAISNLIHSLQAERGASSLYVASEGKRFSKNKKNIIAESERLEARFRELLANQMQVQSSKKNKLLSLFAWSLLGLEDLAILRKSIDSLKLTPIQCIHAYNRLISGLIALILDFADTIIDSRISNFLVSLYHLVQGKELAGQERAIGSIAFASGKLSSENQARITHLVENQDRLLEIFCEFAEPAFVELWAKINSSDATKALMDLRQTLLNTTPDDSLDNNMSEHWFDNCSSRLTDMWEMQCHLIHRIKDYAATLIQEAEADLKNIKGVIKKLRDNPPAESTLSDRFFDPNIPVEDAFRLVPSSLPSAHPKSLIDVLQLQSKRLAEVEHELLSARRALSERKSIEKAKGLLMTRFSLSEEEAYKKMRTTAMEQNKKIYDIAQTIISISEIF